MPLPLRRAVRWLVPAFVLALLSPHSADGQATPLCPSGCLGGVFVTPDGSTATQPANGGPFSLSFNVRNVSSGKKTFALTCETTGGLTCVSVNPSSVTLFPDGDDADVTVWYSTGATGGEVWLTALATGASDDGYYTVTLTGPPIISLVAPVLTSGSRAVVRNRQPIIRALITPVSPLSPIDSTLTVLSWRGTPVTSLARANRGVVEWEVDSAHWLGVGDSAEIVITACALGGQCQTVNRWAVLPNDQKPVLGFSGMPLENLGREFSSPFGSEFSVSGAEVETGFTTPPFFSMGIARSAGLVYSTRQSYPRALVPVDLELTWPAGTPDQVKLILFDGVTKLDSLTLAAPTCATGSARRCRAVLQGDFASGSYATPTRKWLTIEAQVTSGGTTQFASDSAEVVIVDRRTTWYGSGWWPSGVLKLVAAGNDRVLIDATGSPTVYRGNGDSLYLSPPGASTSLVRSGGLWELRPRGSTAKLRFDFNGRLAWIIDQNGNQDTIKYNGSSDQVTAFKDRLGKTITFGYDGSSKLSTITDHGGRQTKITIDAVSNQLTYDSIASPTNRSYTTRYAYQTYPGANTNVLVKRIGVIADTTTVTYDSTFKRRPVQVTLPRVEDENGTSVTPTVLYTAVQRRGFGSLVSLDSVYVQLTDPRGNWTRSLMNRWGQARKTWDALGTIARTEFTPEGLITWTEGKVADSSRVYSAYDVKRRVVKSFIVRSAADTLRLDSLVYDGNDRVIRSIDSRGQASRLYYDANGNVIASVTPAGDSTVFWYRSDGLLDSTRAPGELSPQGYIYETTWKHVFKVVDEAGDTLVRNTYDSFGRRGGAESKIRVQTGATTLSQWRISERFYTVANELDSTRVRRTDSCADPCEPGPWPPPSDTLRTYRVGHRFDRGGRDSLRIDDRGKAVLYIHDRLGRLVSRRPWTDSMSVKDSMVYDIAGNLRRRSRAEETRSQRIMTPEIAIP
jgi:YD repeat-containing protein